MLNQIVTLVKSSILQLVIQSHTTYLYKIDTFPTLLVSGQAQQGLSGFFCCSAPASLVFSSQALDADAVDITQLTSDWIQSAETMHHFQRIILELQGSKIYR